MFGITPKYFDAVYMGATFRSSGFLSNRDMVSPDCEGPLSLPVVGVIKAVGFRMRPYKFDHLTALTPLDRKYLTIPLRFRMPRTMILPRKYPRFSLPVPAKCGLVAFHGPFKGNTDSSSKASTALIRRKNLCTAGVETPTLKRIL